MLEIIPCLDSADMAASRQRELDVPPYVAAVLGQTAVEASARGYYIHGADRKVDWSHEVQAACNAKVSIPPDAPLPALASISFTETRGRVQVTNETTLQLHDDSSMPD